MVKGGGGWGCNWPLASRHGVGKDLGCLLSCFIMVGMGVLCRCLLISCMERW